MPRFNLILKIFAVYAGLVGFVTFPLFILEESAQMATFGTWAAKNTGNPEHLLRGVEVIDLCNRMTIIINRTAGWIQPLSFYSYEYWVQGSQYYADSLRASILAQNPEVFLGKEVEFEFSPKAIEILPDGRHLLSNGQIGVIVSNEIGLGKLKVRGVVVQNEGRYWIINN